MTQYQEYTIFTYLLWLISADYYDHHRVVSQLLIRKCVEVQALIYKNEYKVTQFHKSFAKNLEKSSLTKKDPDSAMLFATVISPVIKAKRNNIQLISESKLNFTLVMNTRALLVPQAGRFAHRIK